MPVTAGEQLPVSFNKVGLSPSPDPFRFLSQNQFVPGPGPVSNSDPVVCRTQFAIGPRLVSKSDLVCPGPVFKVDTVCPWTQFGF
ncbi:hypothetical protein JEQ12_019679 [Ovis aries]|uniref:Uncharacterized protein n=1 Tax=Ovis aries TaxID=9940 RepID=A0A835ZHU0_SHEEP|nr:hypothetical protein JEQ12_019679 [Ovis aries]